MISNSLNSGGRYDPGVCKEAEAWSQIFKYFSKTSTAARRLWHDSKLVVISVTLTFPGAILLVL